MGERTCPSFFRVSVGGGFAISQTCITHLHMDSPFHEFSKLPIELQREAIREGELRLKSQLEIATAADRRAQTWTGLLITAATAALGAGLALVTKAEPEFLLAFIALAFACGMLRAAHISNTTTEPEEFCLPGNTPSHWLPSQWACKGNEKEKVARALIEQAEALADSIDSNASRAKIRGQKMKASYRIAEAIIMAAGIAVVVALEHRLYAAW